MKNKAENKIEAHDMSIKLLLKDQKYYIDYFQREYRWEEDHMRILIEDLTNAFLKSYNKGDKRPEVANYQSYYLGPVVFSVNQENGNKSIIDGQQRITSITLFLIYLYHLQKNNPNQVELANLIYSEKYGSKSFNLTDDLREPCLKSLFDKGEYKPQDEDDETIENMASRYKEIDAAFPEEIDVDTLPFFIDWLLENVVIVAITAYSEDNAYTIFETMNDRGLNLTSTEMLKGYVLSKITDKKQRSEINNVWKEQIQKLHEYDEKADLDFFSAWFRAKYAISIRPGKAGATDQDFELIGTRFHNWFKDNHLGRFNLYSSSDFFNFFRNEFPFYVKWYLKLWDSHANYNPQFPNLYYIKFHGIADSLQSPLLLASILPSDSEREICIKVENVAHFIETFTVRRSINFKKFSQTSIKYTMFNLMKLLRNNPLNQLNENLLSATNNIEESLSGLLDFGLHSQNKHFVKHLLSRITSFLDTELGKDTTVENYLEPVGKKFEIEHIIPNKFDRYKEEFVDKEDFQNWRNSIGALVLLPQGTNQSFSSEPFEEKVDHYLRENSLAQTLNETFYKKNPNFVNSERLKGLGFKSYTKFGKSEIDQRLQILTRICELIWSPKNFTK